MLYGPDWIEEARYDIDAKIPLGATWQETNLMLQSMLEDRFKLQLHRETRDLRGFNLVVAPDGLKLKAALSPDGCDPEAMFGGHCGTGPPGIARSPARTRGRNIMLPTGGRHYISARAEPIELLANMLEQDFPVVIDKTGLTGLYDFQLAFGAPDASLDDENLAPSIFTVLEKRLGLKLQSGRVPVNVIVIDHIEPPSEN
jgi:uncharacterized protein (TIGR03435 family)